MRIDAPTSVKSWMEGFFSGSFKGNLEGTASYAETASHVENLPDLSDQYLSVNGGTLLGDLIISGSSEDSLKVRGDSVFYGDLHVSGNLMQRGDEISMSDGKVKFIRNAAGSLEFLVK